MATTTLGVKVDDILRARLKKAAESRGRTPHWLIKQAIVSLLERLEAGHPLLDIGHLGGEEAAEKISEAEVQPIPFLEFAQSVQPQSVLRAKITAAYRRPEPECLPLLLSQATLPPAVQESTKTLALLLMTALRAKQKGGGVEGLIHEFSLSSREGVALMCLAEALLRIPDRATRDALIRDKISRGDWHSHVGHSSSLFVNAATWGLLVTGKLVTTNSESGLSASLSHLISKGGEPLIRKGVDIAMRMMGEQFVCGQTIAEALSNSRRWEAQGFRYSYDMLGEAATTADDAARYYADYEHAIHAIGRAAARRGIYEGPGISIKLSALHPRYARGQRDRVIAELLPRLTALAVLARSYDIGLNIDAEEADRLELSLDLLEALCFDPALSGWNGIGFVVQAYQKRAPFVLDWIIDLGHRTGHRLMVRLVKGAYWDSEIKRAQVDGLEGFPVFTRKVYTDVSYLACAKKLLAHPEAVFPQFATHNAQTVASIHQMAGGNYYRGQYEFQCLHGMGEALYEEVVGSEKLDRPCRIYAPVGTHETLLAYLVRRLLENGANTSFVHLIAENSIPLETLVKDPVEVVKAMVEPGAPHESIALPVALYGDSRRNSAGFDLSNEQRLASLSAALLVSSETTYRAVPLLVTGPQEGVAREVRNPADLRDRVGEVIEATAGQVDQALDYATQAASLWQSTPVSERAAALRRAADLFEARTPALLGIIVREAGKTLSNAIGEVREAVDFLRYYAAQAEEPDFAEHHRPLGPVVCISPWNFPLAIFVGQVAAALAAGNPVLAKPAEETPLIAAQAVALLREAGIPAGVVQLLPGAGVVGAQLVADPRTAGVMFTGSTEVAKLIQKTLSQRLSPDGQTIPLIAETGGQNALIVDSSALAEQVVGDVIVSAFDSAGQRCSALRVLCLQEEVADKILTMLKGAMAELTMGNPDTLACDVGPVITAEAAQSIETYIAAMSDKGFKTHRIPVLESCRNGTFVAPTLIEVDSIADLGREVFGPVLHVLRYRRDEVDGLIDALNATGYGLTFGLHSRIDETIAHVCERTQAGNVYVNCKLIGAVVGVQPFGGHGLSGTGPKAGGPLYLRRLLAMAPPQAATEVILSDALSAWLWWVGDEALAERCHRYALFSPITEGVELPGPVGERNVYAVRPRGAVLGIAESRAGLALQTAAALATGNRVLWQATPIARESFASLPASLRASVTLVEEWQTADFDAVLFEGDGDRLCSLHQQIASRPGAVISVQGLRQGDIAAGVADYTLDLLVAEVAVSTNTAAAGGNASLMSVG